jgi:hypothetical protein
VVYRRFAGWWPKRGPINCLEAIIRATEEGVERGAVGALDALLEQGVDVERHLRIGVPDLAHHPLDVEAVGEQRDSRCRCAAACAAS